MRICLFWLLFGFSRALWGAEMKNLYEVTLPIVSEGKPFNQARLIEQAFQTVLVQACGSDKILNVPAIKEALPEVDKYINQFSYHQNANAERYIKVIFNKNRVNQLFHNVRQPLWEKDRPLTLVWLVIERNQKPYWVGGESEGALLQEVEKVLNYRAIPFVFPLLDLADTAQIKEQNVLNEDVILLEESATRYHPDVMLLGRLSQTSNGWQGHWALVKEGEKMTWDNIGTELTPLLNNTAEDLSDRLRGRNFEVIVTDEKPEPKIIQKLTLTISGILNAEYYTSVREYLRHLPSVTQVEIIEVMPEKTIFELETTASKEDIMRSIAEGRTLIENASASGQEGGTLSYKVARGQ